MAIYDRQTSAITSIDVSTVTDVSTLSFCSIGTAADTVTGTTTYQATSYLNYSYTIVQPYIKHTVVETAPASCQRYIECSFDLYANPDVSGLGVITAFLISAYVVLGLILYAYWNGSLPQDTLRRIDYQLFFARLKPAGNQGRRVFEEVVLIFSDQQLLTGLGILIAGYIQAANTDISLHHWNIVIYLAWVSFTVHLMSLSVLRSRLKRNMMSRRIRVSAVIVVFTLLVVALVPTTTLWLLWVPEAIPVRCFWNASQYFPNTDSEPNYDSIIGYTTLTLAFTWKLVQFFDTSRSRVHLWGRLHLECYLERIARRLLQTQPRTLLSTACYKIIIPIYVVFVAFMELFESFMFTIMLLTYTLMWGTLKLTHSRETWFLDPRQESIAKAEQEMGFGQILPLLLLTQPALAALDILLDKHKISTTFYTTVPASGRVQQPPACAPRTLAEVLQDRNAPLLSVAEKADGTRLDLMIDCLYQSRAFKALLLEAWISLSIILVVALISLQRFVTYIVIPMIIASWVPGTSLIFCITTLPWSRRLR